MIKSNTLAKTVSHAENCLYDIKSEIETFGSGEQQDALQEALDKLERLYFMLQESE